MEELEGYLLMGSPLILPASSALCNPSSTKISAICDTDLRSKDANCSSFVFSSGGG
ncbi:hypothetical protein OSCI_3720007 [Kamptonema sp. PCC 6506]|nr:hypothetical protein OSCI_3720007 [Kamptonema sp. PCC 6506]